MPNAFQYPKPVDVMGSIGSGLKNAMTIRDIRKDQKTEEQEEVLNSAFSRNLPKYTTDGKADYAGMGNAMTQDLAGQGQGGLALKVQEALSKMDDAQLERIKKQHAKLRPVNYQVFSTWQGLLKKHEGDKAAASQEMNANYWPSFAQAYQAGGAENVDPEFNESTEGRLYASQEIDDVLKFQAISSREKVAENKEKNKSKGGATALMKNAQYILKTYNAANPDSPINEWQAIDIQRTTSKMPIEKLNMYLIDNGLVDPELPEDQRDAELEKWHGILRGSSKAGGAGAAPAANKPPKGAKPTMKDGRQRTSGGKKVWTLPNGKHWIESKSEPINLAMAPENVPLGSGVASQAQDIFTLQKQYQEALRAEDYERAEQIKRQMQETQNSRRNVG